MSAYLGPRGLERLREQLSERDIAVARSVAEHRFLTAAHVEQLHFVEHASSESGSRVCRRVLARLARDRVLARLARRVGGVRAGSASYVYALGPVGARLLGRPSRVVEPSEQFLNHTLAIADARLQLLAASRTGRFELLRVEIEPRCWRRWLGVGGAREIVRPDLHVVTGSGEFEDLWFLEIDRGTEGPVALIRKCRAYEAYWRTGVEQQAHGAFPVVVWVTPDEERARKIRSVTTRNSGLKQDLFRVVSVAGLDELVAGGAQ